MNRNITPVVQNLLYINIAIFIVQIIGFINKDTLFELFGVHYIHSTFFQPFQFVSYIFFHGDFRHLFGNMFGLLIFGPLLEKVWGGKRFLLFYFVTGIGAGLIYAIVKYLEIHPIEMAAYEFLANPKPEIFELFFSKYVKDQYYLVADLVRTYTDQPAKPELIEAARVQVKDLISLYVNSPMIGASGSIFGLMAGMALLFPNTELQMMFVPFPIKVKYLVGFYAIIELYSGINPVPGDNVAHYAHIGGMIFAYILIMWWKKDNKRFY